MIMKHIFSYCLFFAIIFAASCGNERENISSALEMIDAEGLKKHISVLASDEFGGRAPATEGEQKTVEYIAGQFGALGLQPANNGSWFQEVSMVRITAPDRMQMSVAGKNSRLTLGSPDDFIGGTGLTTENIKIDGSEMIFIGYGINSPEWSWNDYEGLDVKGKTVVMLINDPGYATNDTSLFTGKAMTYFGRWTYKFEEAARQGASAAIIIHETGAASYPWGVVQNSWSGPQFYLEDNVFSESDLRFKGWITTDAAKKLFEAAGVDYDATTSAASGRGFKPVNLNLKASIEFSNTVGHVKSNNVAALLPGNERSDEYIIYTAHWDHLGINHTFKEDTVLNGAVDNATGVAALIEIAEAFTRLPEKQDRSVLFLSVTAEEQGLLGSEFYALNPLFPLNKTVAVINMDALNIFGRTSDMTIIGYGNSDLDRYAERVLERHGRSAAADPTPEKGSYFRSDHFPFARKGVPALYLSKGVENIEHGREWAIAESEKWISENYHKPSDNFEPDKWDFDGMVDDIKVIFETGYDLSTTGDFPGWDRKFPFRSLREEMMKRN